MRKLQTIIFDLDGPLLDVSNRYYFVHQNICKQLEVQSSLNKDEYWRGKRAQKALHNLLETYEDSPIIKAYQVKWQQQIEEKNALLFDEVFPYVKNVLKELCERYNLILVTLRKQHDAVIDEIRTKTLDKYFKNIIVVQPDRNPPDMLKYQAIISLPNIDEHSIFIGDTEVDINAAKMLRIKSIGVLSGIRNAAIMKQLNPDYIINDIRELFTKIQL